MYCKTDFSRFEKERKVKPPMPDANDMDPKEGTSEGHSYKEGQRYQTKEMRHSISSRRLVNSRARGRVRGVATVCHEVPIVSGIWR